METKICSKCGEYKLISEFHRQKSNKYGFSSWCKECTSLYGKIYRIANAGKIREHRANNLEYNKIYYEANRDRIKSMVAEAKAKNPEIQKAASQRYREANRGKCRSRSSEWQKIKISKLKDKYIIDKLSISTGLQKDAILSNPELIQLERLEIALKRKRKEITKK